MSIMERYSNRAVLIRDGIIAVVVLLVLLTCWPLASVPTGSRGVVTQFGRIIGIEPEGLAVILPWQKLSVFSIRAEQADIEDASGSTHDIQPVDTSLTVRYSILTDKVAEVYERYSHNGDLSSYVGTAAQEAFKSVTAKYEATDLITKRQQVSGDIFAALQSKLDKYGAQVINIDMRNFKFSEVYMAAILDKVTQEQKRLAADNKLKTVESEQKQKVAIAEAEATAVERTADGNAYSVLKAATAEAESLKIQNAALAQNKDVLDLRRIQVEQTKAEKWDGKLPEAIYASAPIPFLNVGTK